MNSALNCLNNKIESTIELRFWMIYSGAPFPAITDRWKVSPPTRPIKRHRRWHVTSEWCSYLSIRSPRCTFNNYFDATHIKVTIKTTFQVWNKRKRGRKVGFRGVSPPKRTAMLRLRSRDQPFHSGTILFHRRSSSFLWADLASKYTCKRATIRWINNSITQVIARAALTNEQVLVSYVSSAALIVFLWIINDWIIE